MNKNESPALPTPWEMIRALADKPVEKREREGKVEIVICLSMQEYANLMCCDTVVRNRNADLEELLERENRKYQLTRGGGS